MDDDPSFSIALIMKGEVISISLDLVLGKNSRDPSGFYNKTSAFLSHKIDSFSFIFSRVLCLDKFDAIFPSFSSS